MRIARIALLLLALPACELARAPSGRPAGTGAGGVDSLNRVEQDSVAGEEVRRTLRAYYQGGGGRTPRPAAIAPVDVTVRAYGDVAHAWAVVRVRAAAADTAGALGVDALTLSRQGGRWRVTHLATARELADRPLAPLP